VKYLNEETEMEKEDYDEIFERLRDARRYISDHLYENADAAILDAIDLLANELDFDTEKEKLSAYVTTFNWKCPICGQKNNKRIDGEKYDICDTCSRKFQFNFIAEV